MPLSHMRMPMAQGAMTGNSESSNIISTVAREQTAGILVARVQVVQSGSGSRGNRPFINDVSALPSHMYEICRGSGLGQ